MRASQLPSDCQHVDSFPHIQQRHEAAYNASTLCMPTINAKILNPTFLGKSGSFIAFQSPYRTASRWELNLPLAAKLRCEFLHIIHEKELDFNHEGHKSWVLSVTTFRRNQPSTRVS
jgi:hypothetical protein